VGAEDGSTVFMRDVARGYQHSLQERVGARDINTYFGGRGQSISVLTMWEWRQGISAFSTWGMGTGDSIHYVAECEQWISAFAVCKDVSRIHKHSLCGKWGRGISTQ
jgi:hypothetical protein